jgi:hypothetical protein
MRKILIQVSYLLVATSTLFFSCSDDKKNTEVKSEYSYKIVFKEGREIIRQYEIPAVQGNSSFENEADAEKVAKLVVSKLSAAEIPTVTKSELTALGIDIK